MGEPVVVVVRELLTKQVEAPNSLPLKLRHEE